MSAIDPHKATTGDSVCYRHPDRETGILCQRCDKPVCADCRHQASVGVHCPECTKTSGTQKVYNTSNMPGSNGTITKALVGINAAVFIFAIAALGSTLQGAGAAGADYGTWGPPIWEDQEYWRVFSGGFLHSGLIHIGFNMYLLWQLGQQVERVLGEVRFSAVYLTSLLGGSFGAMLLSPANPVVGASGAVFGLIGFTVFLYRSRGIGLFDTGLGFLIVINVLFSFRGGVSLGGHGGGILVGLLLGALFFGVNQGDKPLLANQKSQLAATGALGVVLFVGTILASSTWMAPLFG